MWPDLDNDEEIKVKTQMMGKTKCEKWLLIILKRWRDTLKVLFFFEWIMLVARIIKYIILALPFWIQKYICLLYNTPKVLTAILCNKVLCFKELSVELCLLILLNTLINMVVWCVLKFSFYNVLLYYIYFCIYFT